MRRILISAVAVLALLSCGDSSGDETDEATGGGTEATTTTVGEEPTEEPDEPAPLVLLDPGAEPRVELRYAPVAGATQRFSTSTVINQSIDDVSPGAITTTVEILTEVVSATPEAAVFTATYGAPVVETEPGTPQDVVDAVAEGAGVLADAVARISIDPRGDVLDLELELAEEASGAGAALFDTVFDSLFDSLAQQSVVLPSEPVGVGAQWRVDITVSASGVTSNLQQTFTLVSADATGADLTYTLTGTFDDAAAGSSTGAGTMRVSFDSFFPTLTATSVNELDVSGSTISQTIDQSIVRL